MTFRCSSLRTLLLLSCLLLLAAFAAAQSISGVVTNLTTHKPSAGDDVVLLKLAQGMQELARTKSDSKGHFTIQVPEDGLHLLRVTHDKANYFRPVQPGAQSVEIEVYSAAASVEGVSLDADVMRIQTDAGGSNLRVVEHFFVKNDSSPAKTLFSDHPFELYLPQGATVEGAAAKGPGGMAVQSALVPMGDPNHYTILFPIRPGETEFQVTYRLPYSGSFGFAPRPVSPTDTVAVMMPKAMTFAPATGTPYNPVTEELGAQTFVARNVQPSQSMGFTVSGKGELPRDTGAATGPAPGTGDANAPTGAAAAGTDTRPGGGLGVPVDKDAVRDPWTKYRWWIIGGLVLLFAAGAGLLLRGGGDNTLAALPGTPASPGGAMAMLRDEMFSLETERLEGRLSEDEYLRLKSAYDLVLRRALARSARPGATVS